MTPNPKILIPLFAAFSLLIIGGLFWAGGPEPVAVATSENESPSTPKVSTSGMGQPNTAISASDPTGEAEPAGAAGGTAAPVEKPQILEWIDDAAVSYDAKELPKIQPFLLHSEPEVRKAALDGMVNLGDAAAAPMLRAAAKLALTPEEAVAMNDAAAYVELPSGSMRGMKKKKSASQPQGQAPAQPRKK